MTREEAIEELVIMLSYLQERGKAQKLYSPTYIATSNIEHMKALREILPALGVDFRP